MKIFAFLRNVIIFVPSIQNKDYVLSFKHIEFLKINVYITFKKIIVLEYFSFFILSKKNIPIKIFTHKIQTF